MKSGTLRKRFLDLFLRFIHAEIPTSRFVTTFLRLWKENRDLESELKKTWEQPVDEQLKTALLKNEISKEEFRDRWDELWGVHSESDRAFLDLIDRIFSASDCYHEKPESEYDLDERQLRATVAENLASYFQVVARQDEVRVN